jgi:predicted DNA-binding transcriptional regulator YafY
MSIPPQGGDNKNHSKEQKKMTYTVDFADERLIPNDLLKLYEKQYSRQEAADELGISTRTLSRYLSFASELIPDLQVYIDEGGTLNRRKFESSHLEYLREVSDLLKSFSKDRVIQILTRKYNQNEQ